MSIELYLRNAAKSSSKGQRLRARLFEIQGGKCLYCDQHISHPDDGTLDHIKPRSLGGGGGIRNLAFVCRECNILKGPFESFDHAKQFADKLMTFFERLKAKGIIQ